MAPNINIQDAESGFLMGFFPPPSSPSSSSQVRQMTETLVHTGKCRCACIYSDKLYFIGGCKALDMLIEPKQAPADVWAACKCVLPCTHARTHADRHTHLSLRSIQLCNQRKMCSVAGLTFRFSQTAFLSNLMRAYAFCFPQQVPALIPAVIPDEWTIPWADRTEAKSLGTCSIQPRSPPCV